MDRGWSRMSQCLPVSLYERERSEGHRGLDSRVNFPPHFARLLAPSKQLQGHSGCVNRLAWNENGTMLASGSDDRKVMLWNYPDVDRAPICIDTRHELNIFGVEFMPCTGSSMVISAAYDRMVQLHRLDRTSVPTAGPYRPFTGGSAPIATQSVQCHTQDVAVERGNPHCFWSASVDGRVHQFDLRTPYLTEPDAPNMLIQAPQYGGNGGYRLEFNSLDINNVRPWLMATASSDHLVRVYDRRRLSLRDPSASAASVSLLDLCPLHLHLPGQHAEVVYTTCARFSNRGDRLVTTYHSAARPPEMSYCATRPNMSALEAAARNNDAGGVTGPPGAPNAALLDEKASDMRTEANQAVMQDRWDEALKLYNQLILRVPWLAHSWAARAIVLLHRGWKGDAVWALRDADTCVALNPRWHKAYETRVRCLKVLGQIRTAMTELNLLLEEFPDEAGSKTLLTLREQLEKELAIQANSRNGHQTDNSAASPSQTPSDPRSKSAAETSGPEAHVCQEHAPCRSFRAYLRSLQPDTGKVPSNEAEPSRPPNGHIASPKTLDARCSKDEQAELGAAVAEDGYVHRNGTSHGASEPGRSPAETAAEAAVYGEVGSYAADTRAHAARHADSMAWHNLRAEQLGYDPPSDDGASEGPSGTVRWVRNAIQRSWGAWLAGDSSPGAWQMCRDQAATPADAVFLDALRGQKQPGDSSNPTPAGTDTRMSESVVASVMGSSAGEWTAPIGGAPGTSNATMASRSNSRHHMNSEPLDWVRMEHLREHDGAPVDTSVYGGRDTGCAAPPPWGHVARGDVTLQNGWPDEIRLARNLHPDATNYDELNTHDGNASLGEQADDTLRRLGAVVDEDEPLEVDEEDEEGRADADTYTHAYRWSRGGLQGNRHRTPRQAAGPELLSYIYGHRGWNLPSHQSFEPPAGCGSINSISSLEATASHSMRTLQRFVGQCNIVTHIKEATFIGPDDHIVACGSDHGNVFLFDSITGELLRVLSADQEVANCVQCHPTLPVLATSGLEYVVKLWEVQESDEANSVGSGEATMDHLVRENQQRLSSARIQLPADAELESIIQNPEMLRLVGMTRVSYGEVPVHKEAL